MRLRTVLPVLIVLFVLIAAQAKAAPPTQEEGEVYIVQAGDWLSKLAEKYYHNALAYDLIVEATNAKATEDNSFIVVSNPDLIEVGQKLWLPTAPTDHAAAPHRAPHWSYEGNLGPDHWGQLDGSFATCATGKSQSPIDLRDAASQDLANIVFNYQSSQIKLINNGHTIQVNYDPGSYIELDGQRYDLAQFHFHAPSEHTINGQFAPMELHLVHKSAEGKLAVVGVMLVEGADNPAFQPVMSNLPATEGPEQAIELPVAAADLLPGDKTTYRYSGSLTTPPCSEGVSWLVMTTPVELSAAQLAAYQAIYEGNNRPVQPLGERQLSLDSSSE